MIKTDLEEALERGPEQIKKAFLQWKKAGLDRERLEAKLNLRFKTENPDETATIIKSMVHDSDERYNAKLLEDSFEAEYQFQYEKLMCSKKLCDSRTAF